MKCELTKKEELAIKKVQRAFKDFPKTLWLWSGSGTLHIMKMNKDGDVAMKNGYVDPDYLTDDSIDVINDGGDW